MSEVVVMWAAVTVYAAGAVLYTLGFVFGNERLMSWALGVSLFGLVPHTGAIILRAQVTGHLPFLGFYEVVSSLTWIAVLMLGLLTWRYSAMSTLGVVIMPLSFLTLGAAMFGTKSSMQITPKLASWWLTIHVSFAKLTYACFIASFALAAVYLMRESGTEGSWKPMLDKLPSQAVVDDLTFRFIAAGFIFLGVMIAAGAVWANEAWGRYWGWDPVETWSLISWLLYAVYLHLRLTLGWRGKKAAWFAVAALPVVVFTLVGTPLVYKSIHAAYIKGT